MVKINPLNGDHITEKEEKENKSRDTRRGIPRTSNTVVLLFIHLLWLKLQQKFRISIEILFNSSHWSSPLLLFTHSLCSLHLASLKHTVSKNVIFMLVTRVVSLWVVQIVSCMVVAIEEGGIQRSNQLVYGM